MVTRTGCDAVMIGRMAPSNPWIFRQIEQYCAAINNARVATDPFVHPRSGTGRLATATGSLWTPGDRANWAGHDLTHALNADLTTAALASEGCLCPGTPALSERAVPFPSVAKDDVPPRAAVPAGFYDEPSEADRYRMIRTYFQMLIEEELPDAVGKMKQFASWFTHGVPGGAALRKAIYESKSAPQVLARVEDFFEDLPSRQVLTSLAK